MAKRAAVPPMLPRATLTVDQMKLGIARIQRRIDDLEAFDPQSVPQRYAPEVIALAKSIDGTLAAVFGQGTADYRRHSNIASLDRGPLGSPALNQVRRYLTEGKQRSLVLLRQVIRELEEEIADRNETVGLSAVDQMAPKPDLSKVFIVHGHNDEAKQTVARYVEKLGFQAVILHEQPNKGRTIIGKFREESAGIGFAIVLMTPDDVGGPAGSSSDQLRPRARQNVVFELGAFILAIGQERVAALVRGNIERPSDIDGIVYISMDDGGGWREQLARELKAAGYAVDLNRVLG